MTKSDHRVSVDSGKYTFVIPADDWSISILRYGEPWHGPQGEASNALQSIMCELDAARVVVHSIRRACDVPARIMDALALHDRLVSDREPPSEWCGAEYAEQTSSAEDRESDTAFTADELRALSVAAHIVTGRAINLKMKPGELQAAKELAGQVIDRLVAGAVSPTAAAPTATDPPSAWCGAEYTECVEDLNAIMANLIDVAWSRLVPFEVTWKALGAPSPERDEARQKIAKALKRRSKLVQP